MFSRLVEHFNFIAVWVVIFGVPWKEAVVRAVQQFAVTELKTHKKQLFNYDLF
jgi:hypothetical protein